MVWMPASASLLRVVVRMPATSSTSRVRSTSGAHHSQRPSAVYPGAPHSIGFGSLEALVEHVLQPRDPVVEHRLDVFEAVLALFAAAEQQVRVV